MSSGGGRIFPQVLSEDLPGSLSHSFIQKVRALGSLVHRNQVELDAPKILFWMGRVKGKSNSASASALNYFFEVKASPFVS